jgi:prepilin-type processing-associated H-X9-DG protein
MSMPFTCPHCGTTTDAIGEPAGQTAICGHCGKPVHISIGASVAPKRRGMPWLDLSGSPLGCGVLLIMLIIGCDVIGIGIAKLLPAVQAAREAARRTQCVQNLKQIGLAMHGYHQKYGCFPPAFVPDENGNAKHSWRVLILPFLSEQNLYAKYRFDEPWNSPHNMALADQMPAVYHCPTDSDADGPQTSYAMIVGPRAISDGPTSRSLGKIKDQGAGTMMVAEAANAGIKWLEPRDLNIKDATLLFNFNAVREHPPGHESDIASPHTHAVNVLFCDGTVHILDNSVNEENLKAILTVDGGETVPTH